MHALRIERLEFASAREDALKRIVGSSPAMAKLRENIGRVASSSRPVLVTGPTGAGKELVVQAIHESGAWKSGPLIDVNCGAIPEHLIEAYFFGHRRGAFTSAEEDRNGYLSAADGGTLFLDEVVELPLALQTRLLRVLETRKYRRVGDTAESTFNARIVCATNVDLAEHVKAGRFRADLFYRLSVLNVRVPALDQHREDIPEIVGCFLCESGSNVSFSPCALEVLCGLTWPGNVRQLRNVVDRATTYVQGSVVRAEDLQPILEEGDALDPELPIHEVVRRLLEMPVSNKLDALQRAMICQAVDCAGGNKSAAARMLGIHRKKLDRALDRFSSAAVL